MTSRDCLIMIIKAMRVNQVQVGEEKPVCMTPEQISDFMINEVNEGE